MKQRIRRYGNFNKCLACGFIHDTGEKNHRKDGGYRRLWVRTTKMCTPKGCEDNEYRHKHIFCEKCKATWLECWKEDRVPWWSVWWYRATHLTEQMDRESKELNSD